MMRTLATVSVVVVVDCERVHHGQALLGNIVKEADGIACDKVRAMLCGDVFDIKSIAVTSISIDSLSAALASTTGAPK